MDIKGLVRPNFLAQLNGAETQIYPETKISVTAHLGSQYLLLSSFQKSSMALRTLGSFTKAGS